MSTFRDRDASDGISFRMRWQWFRSHIVLSAVLWLCVCLEASGAAHPLSYTEAWVTISDRIEVRLKVFTDDLIRYDLADDASGAGEVELPESISAEEFGLLLDRQSQELLERIQLFANGEQLKGRLVRAPDAWSSTDPIDVAGNANVKHSLTFEFPLSVSELHSLTVLHSLNPPGIDQPGELRLHSRHQAFSQRLDAVIPPEVDYTLVYREQGDSRSATESANTVQSRLIISPFARTHELTLPLSGFLKAFPEMLVGETTPDIPVLSVAHQNIVASEFKAWMQEHTSLQADGKTVLWQGAAVEFFEAGIIPSSPPPLRQTREISIQGTLIGIRLTSPNFESPQPGAIRIVRPVPGFSSIHCETILGPSASTVVREFPSDLEMPLVLHEWTAGDLRVGESEEADSKEPPVGDLLIARSQPVTSAKWSVAAVGPLLLGFLWWQAIRLSRVGLKRMTVALAALWLLLGSAGILLRPENIEVNESSIHAWMQSAVPEIYASLQSANPERSIEMLGRWLSDDLTESVFVALCRQMGTESDGQTWTGIESIRVHRVSLRNVVDAESLIIEANWRLQGTAFHWGHAHLLARQHSGVFLIGLKPDGWKILEVRELTAQPAKEQVSRVAISRQ